MIELLHTVLGIISLGAIITILLSYLLYIRKHLPKDMSTFKKTVTYVFLGILLMSFSHIWHSTYEFLDLEPIYGEMVEYPEYIFSISAYIIWGLSFLYFGKAIRTYSFK